MVMETSAMVDDEIAASEAKFERPERSPCSECGREFTKLALIYHKKTCTEKEDCHCPACTISKGEKSLNGISHVWEKVPLKYTDVSLSDGSDDTTIETPTFFSEGNVEEVVCDVSFPLNGTTNGLDLSDHETNGRESEESYSSNAENKSLVNGEMLNGAYPIIGDASSEFREDHDGETCNRKLFCFKCKEHIFWESYGIHIIQHCQKLEKDYLLCPECPKSFSRPTMLLLHYFIHASTHPLDCPECRCSYTQCIDATARTVAEHCYAETYHCYICLKAFSHEQSIANHMRLHSKEMPFTCTECNRSFRQVGNLQRHMTTHRGDRPHQCQDCYRSFADPATLRNHMRVHTGETPYTCQLCKRSFTQIGNLKRHIALHVKNEVLTSRNSLEIPPIQNGLTLNTGILIEDSSSVQAVTNVCHPMNGLDAKDENVSSQNNLNALSPDSLMDEVSLTTKATRGRKRNGKFKIFPCPTCKKIYAWKHDLQVHYRTHTGEKPYSCEICNKRFAQSGAVRTHLARHHSGRVKYKKKASSL